MEMDLSIAPDRFRPAFVSLDNAFVNARPGVFEIHVPTPECYRFAGSRALPILEEDKSVVVRPFRTKGLEDDFPLLWRVGINAWLGVGDRQGPEEIPIIEVHFNQAVDSRVPEHSPQAAVNESVDAPGLKPVRFELVL